MPTLNPLQGRLAGFLTRLRQGVKNYLWRKVKFLPTTMPMRRRQILASIFERQRFQEFLHKFSQENGIALDHVEGTVRHHLKEIAADMHYLFAPFADIGLMRLFHTLYEGIEVDRAALEKIRPMIGRQPIVFAPNHRSHMDYLILSYILYQYRFPLPHICAGKNLSFWPLGPIFRKLGAFFIRRSYEGNRLYAACVQFYLEELIHQKVVMEFFIEGGRSRTGKLLPPRMGILSALVQIALDGLADEILIVPTSLTYETVPEDRNYIAEQAGGTKREENLWDLFRLRKYLKKRPGKVYIRFAEPISVREFVKGAPASDRKPKLITKEDKKETVQQIASETTYGINKSAVATPFSLVATTLLTLPGRSVTRDQIDERIDFLLDYLRFKECRLSDTLVKSRRAAVDLALKVYLKERLIEMCDDEGHLIYHVPEERRPLLDYYKNNSIHFFVSGAVLASIIRSSPETTLSFRKIEERYRFVQELFRYEFTFSQRQSLTPHLKRLLEYLEKKERLASFSSLIQNFFESYWIVWQSLPTLGQRPWEQRELVRWLQHRGRILYLKEEIDRVESWNRFPLQNALLSFRDLGILRQEKEEWTRRQRTYLKVVGKNEAVGSLLKGLASNSPLRVKPDSM